MRIEKVSPQDEESILALLMDQFAEHGIELPAARLRRAVEEVFADERKGLFLLARGPDGPVGVAAVSFLHTLEHGGRSAWLDELYVRPDLRNRGVGAALLREVREAARGMGCAAVDLEVDRAHAAAERLYRRAGFRRLARRRWVLPLG
jgi:ribosomal protein S18 acetylase RimI-like enzyme